MRRSPILHESVTATMSQSAVPPEHMETILYTAPTVPSTATSAVEGEVLARFVVDTAGGVEAKSIEILQASHGLFGDAVTEWLRQTRYAPALVSGRPVRQLVQQSIGFTLRR